MFKGVFEQIGKNLSKKVLGKAVPVAGAVIGALFDTAQMNTVLEYADVFYNKKYLLEKEARINTLIGVVKHQDFDYDLTTTHGIELHRFAVFCKKCSY